MTSEAIPIVIVEYWLVRLIADQRLWWLILAHFTFRTWSLMMMTIQQKRATTAEILVLDLVHITGGKTTCERGRAQQVSSDIPHNKPL